MIQLTLWLYHCARCSTQIQIDRTPVSKSSYCSSHITQYQMISKKKKAFQTLIKSHNFFFQVSKFYYPSCVDGESEE